MGNLGNSGLLGQLGQGGLGGGLQQVGQSFPPANVVIPISQAVWDKLTNSTRLAVLSELGIIDAVKILSAERNADGKTDH